MDISYIGLKLGDAVERVVTGAKRVEGFGEIFLKNFSSFGLQYADRSAPGEYIPQNSKLISKDKI